jgi:ribokinase
MAIINIGSINIDHSYRVDHFVRPGETLACEHYLRGLGGKGMNQSIALQRAGAQVAHLGAIGRSDEWAREAIASAGVSLSEVIASDIDTGHAIIQIDAKGENCILLYAGANQVLRAADVDAVLQRHPQHRWVLTQNETNVVEYAISQAVASGRQVAFNPAPCDKRLAQLPLQQLALLLVNEVEVCQLAGADDLEQAYAALRQRCPDTLLVLTLGAQGLRAARGEQQWTVPAYPTKVVDTTGAGDTITGYLLAALDEGMAVEPALHLAVKAAAITVSRPGAAASIPLRAELR